MATYVVDNGMGWSDHVIYFLESNLSADEVQGALDKLVGLMAQEKFVVCGACDSMSWFNDIIWRRESLESFIATFKEEREL